MSNDDPQIRLRAAADQFGAAIAETFKLGLRQSIAKQIAEDFGPGPWILHPDGRVEPYTPPPTPKKRKT
jgi:hypothetical protein